MANTSVTYTADGIETQYTVPFPYISQSHVKVEVNTIEVLNPSIWYFDSASTIKFRNAPTVDSSIKIFRETPGDTRLVDFQNGAVLTEDELDLAFNQIFYLAQEAKENYASLVNDELVRVGTSQGIYDTDPDNIIAGLVNTLLADEAAATLQAAVGDIELNGEVILDIQTKLDGSIEVIDLIGAFNGDETAFLLDTTKVKLGTLDTDPTFASKITTLEAADSANSASITTINTVTIPGIESDITAAEGDIGALEARYGVALNVNGYVTGFVQNNDGTSGNFVVLADKFAIVTPTTAWAATTAYSLGDFRRPTTPTDPSRVFECTTAGTSGGSEPSWTTTLGGTVNDGTVVWTVRDDSANIPFTVEGGSTYIDDAIARNVRYGKTSYSDSTAGYFLGDDSGTPKFKVGNSSSELSWDGSTLKIDGDLYLEAMETYYTPGFTGFSSNPFYNLVHYVDLGNLVILEIRNSMTGTSNASSFTLTGMPLAIRPTADYSMVCQVMDNGAPLLGGVTISTGGTITGELVRATGSNFYFANTAFTSSGQKGFYGGTTFIYPTTF